MKKLKLSLNTAAAEFGTSRETIKKGLRANGVPMPQGATFTLQQIHNAIGGDLRLARTRLTQARATIAENQAAESGNAIGGMASIVSQARALELTLHFFQASLPGACTTIAMEICKTDAMPIKTAMLATMQNLLLHAATDALGWYPLPDWAVAAVRKGTRGKNCAADPKFFAESVEASRQLTGEFAVELYRQSRDEFLARREAKAQPPTAG